MYRGTYSLSVDNSHSYVPQHPVRKKPDKNDAENVINEAKSEVEKDVENEKDVSTAESHVPIFSFTSLR